jgi:hypothetical protein
MEQFDAEQQATIDPSAVQAAIEKLHKYPEPEVGFMRIAGGISPGYNVQTAVDAKHALIVTHAVTLDAADHRCLLPMAEAASKAFGRPATLNVVADTGYSNGEHASRCEEIGTPDATGELRSEVLIRAKSFVDALKQGGPWSPRPLHSYSDPKARVRLTLAIVPRAVGSRARRRW